MLTQQTFYPLNKPLSQPLDTALTNCFVDLLGSREEWGQTVLSGS